MPVSGPSLVVIQSNQIIFDTGSAIEENTLFCYLITCNFWSIFSVKQHPLSEIAPATSNTFMLQTTQQVKVKYN